MCIKIIKLHQRNANIKWLIQNLCYVYLVYVIQWWKDWNRMIREQVWINLYWIQRGWCIWASIWRLWSWSQHTRRLWSVTWPSKPSWCRSPRWRVYSRMVAIGSLWSPIRPSTVSFRRAFTRLFLWDIIKSISFVNCELFLLLRTNRTRPTPCSRSCSRNCWPERPICL